MMSAPKLAIAFWWHHHQPPYKWDNEYVLPWVRFHATKDYLDFVKILEQFTEIKCTINLTPCLLEQIIDYTQNPVEDHISRLTLTSAKDLTPEDKKEIFKLFFMANYKNQIEIFPRYRHLYEKRGQHWEQNPDTIVRRFTESDWRDLQTLYNLCWIGPISGKQEPFRALMEKGKNYSEEDKVTLLHASRDLMAEIIPVHQKLLLSNQIDLTTSPFYHPIIPILIDSTSAIEANPQLHGKIPIFSLRADASAQTSSGIDLFKKIFGNPPSGLWPSEGSISEESLNLFLNAGIQFVGTDEEILKKSMHPVLPEMGKFNLWSWGQDKHLYLLFRDHFLSDRIGFTYMHWKAEDAVNDFINYLVQIRKNIIASGRPMEDSIVPIILDGENCWEYYEENGLPFLQLLYRELSNHELLYTTTIHDFIAKDPKANSLKTLNPGSWIRGNFDIWMGHKEDQEAWRKLVKTRTDLFSSETWNHLNEDEKERVKKEIYIAEGSDWYWWFGDEHYSSQADQFDQLFRTHLKNAYEISQQIPPPDLDDPIRKKEGGKPPVTGPTNFISPKLDGSVSSYFEWLGSGKIAVSEFSSMHSVDDLIRTIEYGFDSTAFYMKIHPGGGIDLTGSTITLFLKESNAEIRKIQFFEILFNQFVSQDWCNYFLKKELEISIPLTVFNPKNDPVSELRIEIEQNGKILVRVPTDSFLAIDFSLKRKVEQDWVV